MKRRPREFTISRRIPIGCKGRFTTILVMRRALPPFGRHKRRIRPVTWIDSKTYDIARIFG